MTKQEFIEAIESIYQFESLDYADDFQLFVDGFYGDISKRQVPRHLLT